MELLLGCGSSRTKRIQPEGKTDWTTLVTLDIEPRHNPDIVHDLNVLPYPFPDNQFDEIHAYEVLEHLGQQGDAKSFFDQFSELWRILKAGGLLCATVPSQDSIWAWGDPSHRRIINEGSLTFLSQKSYLEPPISDFRSIYKADFEVVHMSHKDGTFCFVLKALK